MRYQRLLRVIGGGGRVVLAVPRVVVVFMGLASFAACGSEARALAPRQSLKRLMG